MVAVPRVFEKIEERLRDMGREGSRLRTSLMDWAKAAAVDHHHRVRELGPEQVGAGSLSYRLARKLIFR